MTLLAFPVAIGIAMARYHLYNIDTIVNRTLVYVIVSGFLAGLTAALIGVIQGTFIAVTGQTSDAAIVITTLVLVGVFSPLREIVQRNVDTRFKRAGEGLTGLTSFEAEVRQFAALSDPDQLLMRFLMESVETLDAAGGAVETHTPDGSVSVRTFREWDGDSSVTATLTDRTGYLTRVRVRPRPTGEPYSDDEVKTLQSAADAVADVLARTT